MTPDPLRAEEITSAWPLGGINALAVPGVESICCFKASGPRGLVTAEGAATPALEILAKLATLRGADVLHVGGGVPGLVLYPVASGFRVLLFTADLTTQPLKTAVKREDGRTRTLDMPAWSALTRPLS
ncbi:hypothetical protein ACFRAU_17015 [Arthrobacter sp. NPDC056691]|uniref:hypothetical protein n=1 Tax=Arthrobacter sp. NPDC056691 TaxID=3345913 RepID=UPI00366DC036